jgi:hypothetical protein
MMLESILRFFSHGVALKKMSPVTHEFTIIRGAGQDHFSGF